MKTEISALDLYFLAKEFKVIEAGKIEKVYQWGKEDFIFRLFTPNGKKHLRINMSGLIYFTEKKYKGPTLPPGYCSFLRKYLINAAIKKVYQKGFEKILIIEFESFKYGEMHLIIELLKPANIILCKKEETQLTIMSPLDGHKFKDRIIRGKAKYEFPPEQLDIISLKEEELADILSKSDKVSVKALAIDLGLGGIYAEEIVKRLNLKKDSKIEHPDIISKEVKKLLKEKVFANTKENEIFPIKMVSKPSENNYDSFSQAIDSIIPKIKQEVEEDTGEKKEDSIIKTQNKRLIQLEEEILENQKAGEYIYEHYQEFETLLKKVNELRKEKSFKEIKEILKQNKNFKELNEKEKKIIFEF